VLRVRTWIDEEPRQDGNTAEFIHKIPQMIAFLTTALYARARDILSTGTPAGVGGAQVPPRYMKAGSDVGSRLRGLVKSTTWSSTNRSPRHSLKGASPAQEFFWPGVPA